MKKENENFIVEKTVDEKGKETVVITKKKVKKSKK
jgi:hypothetical protein